MAKYVTFKKFPPSHRNFLTSLNTIDIPKSLSEALSNENWRLAMKHEMQALENNQIWEITDLPVGKRTVGCRWVFRVEYKSDKDTKPG